MPVLVYSGGKNPFLNLQGFIAHAKKRYPTITDAGIAQLVKLEVGKLRPRMPKLYCHLYGNDIMTEDLEGLEIWRYLPQGDKRRLQQHPIVGGATFPEGGDTFERIRLVKTLDRSSVNRSALISIEGLENSYIWCRANGWKQEVTEEDKRLILASPARNSFHDEETLGPYIDIRTYGNIAVKESFTARDGGDVKALQRQFTRNKSWSGSDLKG